MWIFDFLPDWFFHAFGIIGILAIVASVFLKVIPFISNYYLPIRVIGMVMLAFGIFFEGALYEHNVWNTRVKELEVKLAKAEAESAKTNTIVVEKLITKRQVIKQKGDEVVRYIDREIVKYDNSCVIPNEFVQAHNKAAEGVK